MNPYDFVIEDTITFKLIAEKHKRAEMFTLNSRNPSSILKMFINSFEKTSIVLAIVVDSFAIAQ